MPPAPARAPCCPRDRSRGCLHCPPGTEAQEMKYEEEEEGEEVKGEELEDEEERAHGRLGARCLARPLQAGQGGRVEQDGAVIRGGVKVHALARGVLAAASVHIELDPADVRSGVGARAGTRPRAQPLRPGQGALAAQREPANLHPAGQAVVARLDLVRQQVAVLP
eukprot:scaffold58387_cov48-Phaeocystis_antarctica.AAC.2